MPDRHTTLIEDYFDFNASRFPVMCSSDEFHLLPRAQKAESYLDRLENLEPEAVRDAIGTLKQFRSRIEEHYRPPLDVDAEIDRALLLANIDGLLFDLEETQSWRSNPLLYLKIAMIGLDHALNRSPSGERDRLAAFSARLQAVPRLLRQGASNLRSCAEQDLAAAREMAIDSLHYLRQLATPLSQQHPRLERDLAQAAAALEAFRLVLEGLPPRSQQLHNRMIYRVRLEKHFLSRRRPEEIFAIASREWDRALASLNKLQAQIDGARTWQQLYRAYEPPGLLEDDLNQLYRSEIHRLIGYFKNRGFPGTAALAPVIFAETPTYLRSVRSSASFSAALSHAGHDPDIFYLTTSSDRHRRGTALRDLRRRLHREYRFLCAHETVPGHHLLDSVRRSLANPVRRQIESPLFYEGWAYFAESLLFPWGYLDTPMERLVDARRRLWRAARCLIDVGLAESRLGIEGAAALLQRVGFSPAEAIAQVERFQLNPGYQTCYTLGRYELEALQLRHGCRLDLQGFCQAVLFEGQVPFHLLDRKLQQACEPKNV